jgi:hypothetical protein
VIAKRRIELITNVDTQASAPQYELRVRNWGPGDEELEVWQVPAASTPQVKNPVRVAGLRGRNLELVEHRVLRKLSEAGVKLRSRRDTHLMAGLPHAHRITEQLALTLGLLFRVLAPMRSRENMTAVTEGVEAMGREEAGYWLGMAMHRPNPRRVLRALRVLLTDPARTTLERR